MRFVSINVQDFRNLPLVRLTLGGGAVFVVGGNGAGKTSLLEAMCLVSALRSFRTSDGRAMIRHGSHAARVVCALEQERDGAVSVDIELRSGGKTVLVDNNPLPRLSDLVGRFPTVALSSHDIQLLRAGPMGRRRFIDMMLAGADAKAFDALRRYGKALKGRNSLLKAGSPAELAAFEQPLSVAAAELVDARQKAFAELSPLLRETYARIAPETEIPDLIYEPDIADASAEVFLKRFAESRQRDIMRGASCCGPHLDDFDLKICGKTARDYASEGQQRGLVLSLRLAQAKWLKAHTGIEPVILADDILGELDPVRRAAFWDTLGDEAQVIATGTELPPAEAAKARFTVIKMEDLLS